MPIPLLRFDHFLSFEHKFTSKACLKVFLTEKIPIIWANLILEVYVTFKSLSDFFIDVQLDLKLRFVKFDDFMQKGESFISYGNGSA